MQIKKKRRLIALAIVFLFVLSILAAPSALSRPRGKKTVLKIVNWYYSNKGDAPPVNIQQVQLSWKGPQKLSRLRILNQAYDLDFECEEIVANTSLIHLLFCKKVGLLHFSKPRLKMHLSTDTLNTDTKQSDSSDAADNQIAIEKIVNSLKGAYTEREFQKEQLKKSLDPTLKWIFSPLSFEGEVNICKGQILLKNKQLDPIHIDEIDLHLEITKNHQYKLDLAGQTLFNEKKGSFRIEKSPREVRFNVTSFPLITIDRLIGLAQPSLKGLFTEAFGTTLDASVFVKNSLLEGDSTPLEVHVDAKSYPDFDSKTKGSAQFSALFQTQVNSEGIFLKSPSSILFQITPKLAQKFFGLNLLQNVQSNLTIKDLNIPLLDSSSWSTNLCIAFSDLEFNHFKLKPLSITLDIPNFKDKDLFVRLHSQDAQMTEAQFAIEDGLTLKHPIIFTGKIQGPVVQLKIPANIQLLEAKGDLTSFIPAFKEDISCSFDVQTWEHIDLIFRSREWTLQVPAALKNNGQVFTVKKTINIHYQIPPSFPFISSYLTSPPYIDAQLEPFSIPLSNLSLEHLVLNGHASIKQLDLKITPFTNFKCTFQANGFTQTIAANATAKLGTGSVHFQFNVEDFLTSPVFRFLAQGSQIPVPLLKNGLLIKKDWLNILGDHVDLKCLFEGDLSHQTIDIRCKNQHCDFSFNLGLLDRLLYLTKPSHGSFSIAQEKIIAGQLLNKDRLNITEPFLVDLELKNFQYYLPKNPSHTFLENLDKIDAKVELKKIAIRKNQDQENYNVHGLQAAIFKNEKDSPMDVLFVLKALSGQKEEESTLACTISQDLKSTELSAKLNNFPTTFFDFFLWEKSPAWPWQYSLIFGETLSGSALISIKEKSGPIKVHVKGPNAGFILNAQVKDGTLLLEKPLIAHIKTPPWQAGQKPVSKTSTVQNPIVLRIFEKGFEVPLWNFSKKSIQIPRGQLDLSQNNFDNKGVLEDVIDLLKLQKLISIPKVKLWIAPIDFQVGGGKMSCKKTSVIMNENYTFGTYGEIDLEDYKSRFVLEIPSDTLEKAFGIKGLHPDYALHIPFKGPLNNLKVNKKKAALELGSLFLWQKNRKLDAPQKKIPEDSFLQQAID